MLFRKRREPIVVRSIETPLSDHCNLKCAGCDHASPHMGEKYLAVDSLAKDLSALKGVLKARELRLVGGEPLQHPELGEIINIARSSGVVANICAITNGMLLHRIDDTIWESIDRLWLSVYPNVRLKWSLEEIEAKCRLHDVEFDPHFADQFRKVLLNDENKDFGLVQDIYKECKSAHLWKCFTVADGHFFKCAKPVLIRQRLAINGIDYEETFPDGVDLHSPGLLHQRLEEYLASEIALGACRYCLGTSGPMVDHHQLTKPALATELIDDDSETLETIAKEHRTKAPVREVKLVRLTPHN